MAKKIKLGLVGCGHIMCAHFHGYKELLEKGIDNWEIRALCGRKPGQAERFLKRGEGPPIVEAVGPPGDPMAVPRIWLSDFQPVTQVETYSDYNEMLKKADIDAVDIYASVFAHYPIAMASLKAGKHVLVEKPLAITVKASRNMVEAAKKAKKVLGVAENARYSPGTRIIKWVIDKGYIGNVQLVTQIVLGGWWSPDKIAAKTPWRHRKLEAGAGVSLDMGVHLFNTLRYLCGEIDTVNSVVTTFEGVRVTRDETGRIIEEVKNEVDDTFFTLVKFKSGAIGLISFSWALHGSPTSIPRTVYGTKGCIKGSTLIFDDGTTVDAKTIFEEKANKEEKEKISPYGLTNPIALETLEFLKAIQNGREMETSGKDGLKDVAASYAMIESSRMQRAIKVKAVETGRIAFYEREINRYYGLQ